MELEMENLKLLAQPIKPENSIGRISRMDAINNKSINDRMLRKTQEKLKYLKLNLKSLENKDFGFCLICKKQININRIKLMPETRKCINCS